MERVEITNFFVGICHMQVCIVKDATDEEIFGICNSKNRAGTTQGWCEILRDPGAEGAPVPCEKDSERLHLLVVC